MNKRFNHPALTDLYKTLDDITTLEAMLIEAKGQLHKDIAQLPAKIGDNEDLSDAIFHHLYWFDENVPANDLKQTFDRWPVSQTRKKDSKKAIRNAQLDATCSQCNQAFIKEFESRNSLQWEMDFSKRMGMARQETCPECEKKSKIHSGESYHQWVEEKRRYTLDLRAMPYYEYLQTEHWQERRKRAMKRAGYRCQVCNAYGVRLNVHHRTYERRGEEWDSDLITLCHECHEIFHDNGKLASVESEGL